MSENIFTDKTNNQIYPRQHKERDAALYLKKAHINSDSAAFDKLVNNIRRYDIKSTQVLESLIRSKTGVFSKICSWLSFKLSIGKSAKQDLQALHALSRQLSIPRVFDGINPHIMEISGKAIICTPVMAGTEKMIRLETGRLSSDDKLTGQSCIISFEKFRQYIAESPDKLCEGFESQEIDLCVDQAIRHNDDLPFLNQILLSHNDVDIAFLTSLLMCQSYHEGSSGQESGWSLGQLLQMNILVNQANQECTPWSNELSLPVSQNIQTWLENYISTQSDKTMPIDIDDSQAIQEAINAKCLDADYFIEKLFNKSSDLRNVSLKGITLSTRVMKTIIKAVQEGRAPQDVFHGAVLSEVDFDKIGSLKGIHLDRFNLIDIITAQSNKQESITNKLNTTIANKQAPPNVLTIDYLSPSDFEGLEGISRDALQNKKINDIIQLVEQIKKPSSFNVDANMQGVDLRNIEGLDLLSFIGANLTGSIQSTSGARALVELFQEGRAEKNILAGTYCSDVDFSGQDLSNMTFTGTILKNADLRNARLINTTFDERFFHNVKLEGAVLDDDSLNCILKSFHNGNLPSSALISTDWSHVDSINNIDFSGMHLLGIDTGNLTLTRSYLDCIQQELKILDELSVNATQLAQAKKHLDNKIQYNYAYGDKISLTKQVKELSEKVEEPLSYLNKLLSCYFKDDYVTRITDYTEINNDLKLDMENEVITHIDIFDASPSEQISHIKSKVMESVLQGKNVIDTDLSHMDFHGYNVSGTDFSGSNLSFVNFNNCNLTDAKFNFANMSSSTLKDACVENSSFIKSNLTNVDFSGAVFSGKHLTANDAVMHGTIFDQAKLSREIISNIINATKNNHTEVPKELINCDVSDVNLDNLDTGNLDLIGEHFDFSGISLQNTRLSRKTINSIIYAMRFSYDVPVNIFKGSDWSGIDIRNLNFTWEEDNHEPEEILHTGLERFEDDFTFEHIRRAPERIISAASPDVSEEEWQSKERSEEQKWGKGVTEEQDRFLRGATGSSIKKNITHVVNLADVNLADTIMDRNNVIALMAGTEAGFTDYHIFRNANLNQIDLSGLDMRKYDFEFTKFHGTKFKDTILSLENKAQLFKGHLQGRGDIPSGFRHI